MNKVELQNDIYEIKIKADGIRDLIGLLTLGCAGKQSDIGDALDPVFDSMVALCDMIDKLHDEIGKDDQTAERDPEDLPFT